jgi:hypothetical protein
MYPCSGSGERSLACYSTRRQDSQAGLPPSLMRSNMMNAGGRSFVRSWLGNIRINCPVSSPVSRYRAGSGQAIIQVATLVAFNLRFYRCGLVPSHPYGLVSCTQKVPSPRTNSGYSTLTPPLLPWRGRRLRPHTPGTVPRPTPLRHRPSLHCRDASPNRRTPGKRSGWSSGPSGRYRLAFRTHPAPCRPVFACFLLGLVNPTCGAMNARIGENLSVGFPYTLDEGHRGYLLPGPGSPGVGLVAHSEGHSALIPSISPTLSQFTTFLPFFSHVFAKLR